MTTRLARQSRHEAKAGEPKPPRRAAAQRLAGQGQRGVECEAAGAVDAHCNHARRSRRPKWIGLAHP